MQNLFVEGLIFTAIQSKRCQADLMKVRQKV